MYCDKNVQCFEKINIQNRIEQNSPNCVIIMYGYHRYEFQLCRFIKKNFFSCEFTSMYQIYKQQIFCLYLW